MLEAGIERAKGLVAVVSSDADNVYIVLSARSLNPALFIVARAEEVGAEQKLLRAGADRVESPYEMGGRKMANAILRPTVTTFMELALTEGLEWSMEEIAVGAGSSLVGVALKDSGLRQKLDLILVAIKRGDGEMLFNPSHETPILAGDTLIALGMRRIWKPWKRWWRVAARGGLQPLTKARRRCHRRMDPGGSHGRSNNWPGGEHHLPGPLGL